MPTFNQLPFEIRAMIWRCTVEPRTVEIRILKPTHPVPVPHLFSPTPVPAALQTCREARNLGLYKDAWFELNITVGPDRTERRYVWLNLEIDIVSIGPADFCWFVSVAPDIRRLKFERDFEDHSYSESTCDELCWFVNVEEIHVVCEDGLERWYEATEKLVWPCKLEKLTFIDALDGRVMKALDMDRMFAELWTKFEEERRLEEAKNRRLAEQQSEEEEEANRT